MLKIEPDIPDNPEIQQFFIGHGFRQAPTIQPRCTSVVDLRAPTEEIRSRFHLRTRHNLATAIQKGVRIWEAGAAELPAFHRLLEVSSQHRQVPALTLDYFRELWRFLSDAGLARLFLASYRNELLAGAIVLVSGRRAYYMYGASVGQNRVPGANDLLQWTAMQWAQERGCITYDLWGVPDEVGEQVGSSDDGRHIDPTVWGAAQFKRGFGGTIVRYAGAFDYVYSPARFWVVAELIPAVRPHLRWIHQQIAAHRS